ncbi:MULTISPECIES: efflux RND transporter periplasmic adaptor subunit [Pseudoxanthomonas]|jgi:membrane fusion protein (multidrug efflux system)|uniref:HlyD family efflux transporter periplasmic adaptor subunit n=1 Tax=Pseudoxanthomonas winnipegensis TaxID=2480810 RepID=A0A4Q8LI71_9GAMM|nr:efflux RND transporter periplasmic adaptor subunit [Pseudoxanthomonas winnipegensis]RZZ84383.1 HlyD family efflux transporter periplasmic adaptor subunit [Pseudoxanthomonas winnipegensis]RZZ90750.1 HlyD family efflux transporter periplasmic adaptor subunit [Pseudoxanthomonas winnipegensis]TAA11109.1 HlyD family efflux transporter periplasmic adaptor subunit [Pseudoxanthomonas winnipegensis]TAA18534.1 HlyD family efflux transporter periplasmic adaptor subunit [Pseudoxanthomonas winnipegensis]
MNSQTPNAQAGAQPPKKSNRKRSLLILLLVIVVAGVGWIAYELLYGRWHQSTDDAYVAGNIVSIVPQTMGTVVSIDADNGMKVEAGQPLVHLDPNDAQVSYDQAVANLAGTVRQVRGLYSSVESSESDLRARQVAVDQARADVKRREGLVATGAVSREELAHARDILASAEAALGGARGNLQRTRALVDATTVSKTPQVQAASSQLRQAYLNLQRTAILAPVSGYVAQRRVQLGQQVQPGTTLMTIVPIDQVWIEANFKETQLGKMRIGQPVEVHADLYGDDVTYQGKVDSLGLGTGSAFSLLPAQNASGNWIKIVQRLPVKIVLDPKQLQSHPLRIGLSTDVNVSLKDQNGPVLAPARPADAKPLMTTAAYNKQLADANQLITSIIEQNLPESAKTN